MMEHIEIIALTVTVVGAIIAFVWRVNAGLSTVDKTCEGRVKTVFRRMDEERGECDNRFVNTKVCDARHEEIMRTLKEIKDDIRIIRNGNK